MTSSPDEAVSGEKRVREDDRTPAVKVLQSIRAGWLPHRVGDGWWWGRPRSDDGFRLWCEGLVPCMSVVEPMPDDERDEWIASLHGAAPEKGGPTDG